MTDYRDLANRDFAEQRRREGRELEEREAEFARAKRQRQREERRTQRNEIGELCDELRAEIAAVQADVAARHEVIIGAAGEALGQTEAKILDHVSDAIRKVQNELFGTVERRFGELMGRLDAFMPERPRPKDFKFAGERDDGGPLDLPNPLPRRGLN
jgi:hypothetical protein